MKQFQRINLILTSENIGKLIIFFILMLFTVVFETIGIALILPAITFVIDSDLKTNSQFLNDILNYFTENFDRTYLLKIVFVLILITFLIKNIILIIFLWWNKRFVEHLYREICLKLLNVELQKSYLDHINTSSALVVRNFNEVKAFLKYLENFVILFVESAILILIVGILLLIEYKVTLSVGALLIFLVVIFRAFTNKLIKNYGEARFFRSGEMMKTLIDFLNNYKNIKIFNKSDFFTEKFKKDNFIYSNVNKKFQIIDNLPRFWLEIAGVLGLCSIVYFLLFLGYGPKSILPILGVFTVAFFRMIPSVLRIVRSLQAIRFDSPVTDQLFISLKDLKPYKKNLQQTDLNFSNTIQIKNLSFQYPNKERKILNKLNFEIKKGERIGIKGETGVGKSTLIDLLLGFLTPTEGQILIDNKNIHLNLNKWRSLIGYVPQKINVINGTIKDNILFGSTDYSEEIQNKKLQDSINISEFEQVIAGFKNGFDTIVGDKGLDLSGGQLQRLAFARALFKDPDILILDESTNALDLEIEKKLFNNLIKNKNEKTIIMISHNLETLKFCNSVFELKDSTLKNL